MAPLRYCTFLATMMNLPSSTLYSQVDSVIS